MGAALEREWVIAVLLIADISGVMAAIAAQRPFWFDEFFTYYVSRLESMSAVWDALRHGADLNPPLFYVATRFWHSLFGVSELTTRLPAILGFVTMQVGIYIFVARFGSRLAGMAAMAFPLVTGAFYYSYEARAYGMELGLVMLAAVAWQSAAGGHRRTLALPALCLCLAGALLSHCYSVLAVSSFGIAECVRSVRRRRVDWPMIFALGIPCLAVLTYLPLLSAVQADPFDNVVFRATIRASLEMILAPAWWPILFVLIVASLPTGNPTSGGETHRPTPEEFVLLAGFVAAPVFGWLLASGYTKIFMERYGLAAILGLSALLGILVTAVARRSRPRAVAVLCILLVSFLWRPVDAVARSVVGDPIQPPREFSLTSLDPKLPIVMANGFLFLERSHYEAPELVRRFYFLLDKQAALRITGTYGFAQLEDYRPWFPIRGQFANYREFLAAQESFYVITCPEFPMDWVLTKLREDRANIRYLDHIVVGGRPALLVQVDRR